MCPSVRSCFNEFDGYCKCSMESTRLSARLRTGGTDMHVPSTLASYRENLDVWKTPLDRRAVGGMNPCTEDPCTFKACQLGLHSDVSLHACTILARCLQTRIAIYTKQGLTWRTDTAHETFHRHPHVFFLPAADTDMRRVSQLVLRKFFDERRDNRHPVGERLNVLPLGVKPPHRHAVL